MRWTWALFVLLPTLAWGHAGVPFGLQPHVEGGELLMGGGTTGFIYVEEGVATWSCEDAFFLQPNFWHPTQGGRLLAGTAFGLRGSTDRGCSWSDVTKLGNDFFSDLEPDPVDPLRLWMVTGTQGATNRVYRSVDDGVNWQTVREDDTVDFREIRASDDGSVLFLVGRRQGDRYGVLWSSSDGGDTWSDPLVLEGWEAVDLLTVSEDAGTLYLSAVAEKGGFWLIEVDAALSSPAVGLSDWYSPPTSATELDGHLFVSIGSERLMVRAPDGGGDFKEIPERPLSCLDRIDGVLWGCSFPPNFPQYLSSNDLGQTWQAALNFSDVVQRDCPVGTAAAEVCPEVWKRLQTLQIQLGDDDDDDVTPDDDDTTIFFDDDDDDDDDSTSDCNNCGASADPPQAAFLLLLPLVRRRSR